MSDLAQWKVDAMWHTVLITAHALTGTVAFIAGLVAHRSRALFGTYLWSLIATVVFLTAAVAEEWGRIDGAARALFAAFVVLGGVMVWCAVTGRIGFTLVALFDAFIVVTVLNMGAPVALVVASGVVVAIAGHFVLRALRVRAPSTGSASTG